MSICFIEPHYLPSLAYFKAISQYDIIGIDIGSKFIKQTYRNRCRVLLSNKIGQLVIPIRNNSLGGSLSDVKIDYSEKWNHVHWKTIQSAYGKTPFFEHYRPYFEIIYTNPPVFLVEFILEHLKLCFKLLGWNKQIVLIKESDDKEEMVDLKNIVHSKKSKFRFYSKVYYQAFGEDFIENLSIIDTLFNVGPESSELVMTSELIMTNPSPKS